MVDDVNTTEVNKRARVDVSSSSANAKNVIPSIVESSLQISSELPGEFNLKENKENSESKEINNIKHEEKQFGSGFAAFSSTNPFSVTSAGPLAFISSGKTSDTTSLAFKSFFRNDENLSMPFDNKNSKKVSEFSGSESAFQSTGSIFGKIVAPSEANDDISRENDEESENVNNEIEADKLLRANLDINAAPFVPAQDVKNGEEDEICVLEVRAKLYKLKQMRKREAQRKDEANLHMETHAHMTFGSSDVSTDANEMPKKQVAPKLLKEEKAAEEIEKEENENGEVDKNDVELKWVELGVGPLHLNRPSPKADSNSAARPRIVMRREGVLKLLLNAGIWEKFPVEKASEKTIRFTCSSVIEESSDESSDQLLSSYLLKFGRDDTCQEVFEAIEDLKTWRAK